MICQACKERNYLHAYDIHMQLAIGESSCRFQAPISPALTLSTGGLLGLDLDITAWQDEASM